MQDIIAKYRKIMEKPVPAPFDGYLRELVEALEKSKDGAKYVSSQNEHVSIGNYPKGEPAIRKKIEVKKVLLKHDKNPNPNSYEETPVPHLNQ